MGKIIRLPVESAPADGWLSFPLHVLQVIPDFVDISTDPNRPFNLFGALAALLGSRGWGHVMVPKIWSPGRTTDQLRQAFPVRSDLGSDPFLPSNFVLEPPFVPQTVGTPPPYEIIHISAPLLVGPGAAYPDFGLKAVLSGSVQVLPGQFRDMAVQYGTRLTILDQPKSSFRQSEIDDFARAVAGAGGPAMLVVKEEDPQVRDTLLTDTYAVILHNQPLSSAVRSVANVDLYIGRSADRSLSFDSLLKQLQDDQKSLLRYPRLNFLQQYLRRKALSSPSLRTKVDDANAIMASVSRPPWNHESEGAIPLAEASELIADVQLKLARVTDATAQAPRVLNANFGAGEQKLPPNQPLVAGGSYDLLVDIGPRWEDGSIVSGNEVFPIDALPRGFEGHIIDVISSTADFEPPNRAENCAEIGQSFPVVAAQKTVGDPPGD